MNLEEIQKKRKCVKENTDKTLKNIDKLANESLRVADVANHSEKIIEDLDKEFEEATGLNGKDVKFLFAAMGLQFLRIVFINKLTEIEAAGKGEKEKWLHEKQQEILSRFDPDGDNVDKLYHASMEHIITNEKVPYDATTPLTDKNYERIIAKKGKEANYDPDAMRFPGNFDLFKGGNHRFSTMGHDPIAGLLFGTGNIMTNTITCVRSPLDIAGLSIPVLTTNHVFYTKDYKYPMIGNYGMTTIMIQKMIDRTIHQPSALVASLIKQIIHIGTDLYTPCGIEIPLANLCLDTKSVEDLTMQISTGDIIKVGMSAKFSELINCIISTIHGLMNDGSVPKEVYNVKTRKIVSYSNAIVSSSNVIWASAKNALLKEANIHQIIQELDLGGLLVTLNRLINDAKYIREIKREFVFGNFNKQIQGEILELEEVDWEMFHTIGSTF